MGSSKFISTAQAAKIIGCHPRSIYRYAKRGVFEYECVGRSMLVAEQDVLTFTKGRRDILSSPLQRGIIAKLQAEIQTLKTQMATCMRILNVRYDPLAMTVPEYELFYQSAQQFSVEGWSPHIEEMWAEYFVRIKVEDLEKIELATNDPHPWRPLLRLATTMHLNPWNKDLTELLAAGRTNLQQVAGVWCVLKEESPRVFDILLERDTAPLRKLVKRLQKSQV